MQRQGWLLPCYPSFFVYHPLNHVTWASRAGTSLPSAPGNSASARTSESVPCTVDIVFHPLEAMSTVLDAEAQKFKMLWSYLRKRGCANTQLHCVKIHIAILIVIPSFSVHLYFIPEGYGEIRVTRIAPWWPSSSRL